MWDSIVERVKLFPEFGFFRELFEAQQKTYERFEELMAGERQPLDKGVLMASIAFVSKTYRELYPIIERGAPEPIRSALGNLRKATSDDLLELLAVYYLDDRIPRAALQHLPDEALCRWFARAFLLPAAPQMLERTTGAAPDFSSPFRCPRCRHKPQLVVAESTLVCSMCFFEWTAPAKTCPACRSPEWQSVELDSRLPNVDLLVCPDCKAFLKRVKDGVPLVDELVTVELDDRARAQGWKKIEPNLLLR